MSTPDHTEYSKGDKSTFGGAITGLTPGVENIQKAYSRAGGSDHHTPGAATKLGSQEQHGRNETAYRSWDKSGGSRGQQGRNETGYRPGSNEPTAFGQFVRDMLDKATGR